MSIGHSGILPQATPPRFPQEQGSLGLFVRIFSSWVVSVTERVKTLFFSPYSLGAGGGGRSVPASLQAAEVGSRLPPLRLPPTKRLFQWLYWGPGPGGPGPKALEAPAPSPGPQAPANPGPRPRNLHWFRFEKRHLFRLVARLISPGHSKLGAGRPACWS